MTHTTSGGRTAAAASSSSARRRRLLSAAAVVVLLPGLLAACSSGSPESDPSKAAAGKDKGDSVSECMRGKGYDMDDAAGTGSGNSMQLSVPDGVDKEQWSADFEKCMGPVSGAGDSGGATDAKPGPGQAKKEKKFLQCVRENGFADYPDDPDARGTYQPDDENAFHDVMDTCDREAFGTSGTADKP
ncbi:hypothetical protein DEJ28_02890 [Curtobacterium sp. MCPF17_002]|uniref:hypothetical protein n=1 Tax=Curtobacterium sp. MCPF17_002 TaxID=2175645 RepID=UPI000DA9091E|nr:hypothetical protein [Curtobacterium sp. MCPF17_002]WIB78061.1 hypothetical protein DEJ28_02890 [Curtobacterium sp. MCPF17_002]